MAHYRPLQALAIVKKVKIQESHQMWAIEDSPGPKVVYRVGWYHFDGGYTTALLSSLFLNRIYPTKCTPGVVI